MPKKQIGKKIDEQGNLTDLGYTVTQEEINNWNNKANVSDIPTSTSQLTNDSEFINKDVNNLTNYTLAVNTASSIEMSIDDSTYVVSLKLKNAEGTQLGETQTIDLPLESVVVNGSYDSTTKEVILTLDNGSEIRFSVADLVSGLAKTSDLNNYLPLTGGTLTATSGDTALHVQSKSTASYIGFKDSNGALLGYYGVNSSKKPVFYSGGDKVLAYASDIPDVSVFAKTTDLANYVPTSRTVNGKTLSSNISLGSKDIGALPDYTLTISHQSAGNPRMVKFVSVNYSSKATCFKMGAMTCHDNGVSYQFLTDMLISVTTAGAVTANIYKFAQSSIGSVDGVARYTGDVFYVNDTTNKIVDFYILCGQWSASQFTPVTKVGSTTIANVTQYSGNATYYSSGTKEWANGCGTTYARLSDIPDTSSFVTTDTEQTITGKKKFSGNGLTVSGRALGSGDDEGIVVSRASNNYAGICLGDPSGTRSVMYLLPDNSAVWRFNNGSSSYDIKHPSKAGTIALTSDLGTQATYSLSGTTLTITPK